MEVNVLEIKINREVRNYKESIFFGLSLRQFICVLISCGLAIFTYFSFREKLGLEITSWICIFIALPFILIGFVKYNGMNFEDAIVAFIYSKFLIPKKIYFKADNIYVSLSEEYTKNEIRKELKRDRAIFKKRQRETQDT